MAQHGAKNIAILSPSGSQKFSTKALIDDLAQIGTRLQAFPCDVASDIQVKRALEECRKELPPIRGLIQGALQLRVGFSHVIQKDTLTESRTRHLPI